LHVRNSATRNRLRSPGQRRRRRCRTRSAAAAQFAPLRRAQGSGSLAAPTRGWAGLGRRAGPAPGPPDRQALPPASGPVGSWAPLDTETRPPAPLGPPTGAATPTPPQRWPATWRRAGTRPPAGGATRAPPRRRARRPAALRPPPGVCPPQPGGRDPARVGSPRTGTPSPVRRPLRQVGLLAPWAGSEVWAGSKALAVPQVWAAPASPGAGALGAAPPAGSGAPWRGGPAEGGLSEALGPWVWPPWVRGEAPVAPARAGPVGSPLARWEAPGPAGVGATVVGRRRPAPRSAATPTPQGRGPTGRPSFVALVRGGRAGVRPTPLPLVTGTAARGPPRRA